MDDSRALMDEEGTKMNAPKLYGVWTVEEIKDMPDGVPAQIDGRDVFCPFCKAHMKMWLEGCTLGHIFCRDCGFCLTRVIENDELFKKLIDLIHE